MARIKAKPVYTEEFRNEALNMLRGSDRTIREVSSALGMSDWTLYLAVLHSHGITVSMSRRGNCWDNAVAESFFATLKTELIYDRIWQSRAEIRAAIFEYIEVFYNRQRLHSTLGYKTPHEIETQHAALQAA